jgi:hypothetical protein
MCVGSSLIIALCRKVPSALHSVDYGYAEAHHESAIIIRSLALGPFWGAYPPKLLSMQASAGPINPLEYFSGVNKNQAVGSRLNFT